MNTTSNSKFDYYYEQHIKNNTMIIMGDSHVNFWSGNEKLTYEPIGYKINVCPCINAKPYTVLHIGSVLAYNVQVYDTYYHFREKYELLEKSFFIRGDRIMFSLGEIDLRVHVFKQTLIQGLPYQEIVKKIVDRYFSFLLQVKEHGYIPICWGPIATQPDIAPLSERFPRKGTEVERNKATELFTIYMKQLCEQHNILFLSIFSKMISSDYHTNQKYLASDYVHLSQKAMSIATHEISKL